MDNLHLVPAPIQWEAMAPIIGVTLTGILAMAIEMVRPRQTNNVIVITCLLGLVASFGIALYYWQLPPSESFGIRFTGATGPVGGGLFLHDRFGQIITLLLIAISFVTVLFSEGYLREKRIPFGEYYPLILWSAVGGMIMATTRDLLIVFLGLETLSISLYVLAGLSSKEKRSQESALKYFLLGAFASSFMLFGIALMYGATGTTHVSGISEVFASQAGEGALGKIAYAGLGLILIGFGFKAALVPFHMWTPDVYQGAPTSVTGFMAAGSKVAAFAALFRFLDSAVALRETWIPILTVLAVITMTGGNLIALAQKDVKRILGYSSIAHAGYLLAAIVAWATAKDVGGAQVGSGTLLFYLISYSVMTLGAFAVLTLSSRGGKEGTLLEDFYGLWRRAPFAAAMMIIFMASLAGIPPTGGFVGKFLIFKDLLDSHLGWLAIVLAVNSVISVFYYLKIVMAICVKEPELRPNAFSKMNSGLFAACALCGMLLLTLGILVDPLRQWLGF